MSLTLCSLYLCLCCDGMLCEDLLFSCCESVVAEVDYCVGSVRLMSWLVCGILADSCFVEFLTN